MGGEGGLGLRHTEEEKRKLSSERMGKDNPFYGIKHEDGWLEMVLKASMEVTTKSILQIDKHNGNIIKTFNSISDASREMKCSVTAISRCLNGKSNYSMGYYWKYNDDTYKPNNYEEVKSLKPIKVLQIDKNTNEVINIFESVKEAGYYIGMKPYNISNCLIKRQNTAGGYKWNYL